MLAGTQVPAGSGVSTILPHIDFETYSEAGYVYDADRQKWTELPGLSNQKRGLKGVGLYNYVRHPTFEVICLAYDLKDGTGPRLWRPGMEPPDDLWNHVARAGILEAHNAEFEFEVWNTYCVRTLGWPEIFEGCIRCSMAKARAQSYPGALGELGIALRLPPELQKDKAGDALIRKLTVPKNPTKKHAALRWTRADLPEEFAAFDAYCVQDIITEGAASLRIKDQSPRELAIWQMDQRVNRRGMQIDVAGNDNCIAIIEQCREKYNAHLRYITNGHVSGYTKAADLMAWMATQGSHVYSLDEENVDIELARQHSLPVLEALEIRKLLSFGSVNKCFAIRAQVCSDGRLRGQYAYHGAHTSLWNGINVQPANMYKGKLDKPEKVENALAAIASQSLEYVEACYGDALETVADCLRSLIIAAPGHDLIAADYTAIQAVVTAALAGEEWALEVFRTHGKIYEATAALITGKTLQFYLDYRRENGKHHDDRQPYGKIAFLSSGFGGWIGAWKKFGASDYMTDEEIKRAILTWRAKSPAIVNLWGGQVRNKFQPDERAELYGLEGAAVAAVLEPGRCFGYRGIRYLVHGDALYCQPPTDGDPIVYREPRLEPSTRDWSRPYELSLSYSGYNSNAAKGASGWVRMYLYGGVLTQHVVSKVSREFQADALCALDGSGIYSPVMHTHDEAVSEVPQGQGSIEEYLSIVNRPKPWAIDDQGRPWPVKAPGAERTFRYGKWE